MLHEQDVEQIERLYLSPLFARYGEKSAIVAHQLEPDGRAPEVAYQLIHDEVDARRQCAAEPGDLRVDLHGSHGRQVVR